MRLILRFFATFLLIQLLLTAYWLMTFWANGGLRTQIASGFMGVMGLLALIVVLTVGPLAALLLWQLRKLGLYLTALLVAFAGLYALAGMLTAAPDDGAAVSRLIFSAATVALLLSPPARRACPA